MGHGLLPMKSLAQLTLGANQNIFLFGGKVRTCAVDIEVQHGHRRLIRIGFAPRAGLGGTLQRKRDSARVALFENIRFKIKRIAAAGDLA